MIFYFNERGEQIGLYSERIFQGTTKTNGVILVCPATDANTVSARFELADRRTTCEVIMERDQSFDACSLKDVDSRLYSAWVCDLPNYATSIAGTVKVQFAITSIQGVTKKTATSTFTVEEGVISPEPERYDTYDDVLSAFTKVNNEIERLKLKIKQAGDSVPLYVHTLSGTFSDHISNKTMSFNDLKVLSEDQTEITISNAYNRLPKMLCVISGSISEVGATEQNVYSPVKFTSNYGITIVLCTDHENIDLKTMIFAPETIFESSVSLLGETE